MAWYDRALAQAGRDRSEVNVILAREVFLAEDADAARKTALPILHRHLDAARAEANEDQSGLAVLDGLDESTLLDACVLIGTPQEFVGRLKALQAEAGINHLLCRVYLPGRDHAKVVESIRLLASQLHTRLLA